MALNKSMDQYENKSNGSQGGSSNGLLYLLIGGGIGVAVALLFAPKAGTELRGDISDVTRRGYDQTADLARRAKDQTVDLYNTVRAKTGDVLDLAASKTSDAQDAIEETIGKVGDNANTAIHQLENKFGKKDSNSDAKSANAA